MSWGEFLTWLSQPGGVSAAVGILTSWLVDYWPWFASLPPKGKTVAFLVLSLFIPLAAAALGCLTSGWAWSWEATFWPALVAGATAFFTGTAVHLKVKNGKR